MSHPKVVIFLIREESKVLRRNHLPEDALRPLLPRLLLIFDREVFADEPWCDFYDLNDLVLENE